jgi:hypothetical protein
MRRSTLVALLVLAALGGLYWYTRQDENAISRAVAGTPTPTLSAPGFLVDSFDLAVNSLVIELADGRLFSMNLVGGAWNVKADSLVLENIDQAAAATAAENIKQVRILSELELTGGLQDFGLQAESATRITSRFADGTSLTLRIGNATPTDSGYYAIDETQPDLVLVLAKFSTQTLLELPDNPPVIVTTNTPESTPAP